MRIGRTLSPLLGSVAIGLSLLAAAPGAGAADVSLQYRNHSGFVCHHYNNRGECTDFSYFDSRSSSNYYNNYNNDYYYSQPIYRTNDYYYPPTTSRTTSNRCTGRACYGDVTVSVTASPDPVEEDDIITYRIYVRNDDSSARLVDVVAFLDDDMVAYDGSSDRGRLLRRDEVEWNISMSPRSSKTLTLRVRADDVNDGDEISLRVEAEDDSDDVDVEVRDDRDDDDDDDCNRFDDCDISVDIRTSEPKPNQGELVTFSITLENDGNNDARVDVRALLDEDLIFFSASDSGDDRSRDEVEWENILVREDDERVLTFAARVRSDARTGDRLTVEVETDGDSDEVSVRVR